MESQIDLEKRVIDLVTRFGESPFRETGKRIKVTRECEVYAKGGYYAGSSPESYECEEREIVYDTSRRRAVLAEFMEIGKPAIPILTKILTSEEGDYPNSFCHINEGVLPALVWLGDEETSRSFLEPFQKKVRKVAELRAEKYCGADPYEHQVWSIARLWKNIPIQEAVPLLDAAARERPKYDQQISSFLFSESIRSSFIDAMCMTATKDAISTMLNAGKEDLQCKAYASSNCWWVLRSLQENKEKVGEVLYDIYCSTGDAQIKEMASSVLGYSRAIYWLKRKLGR